MAHKMAEAGGGAVGSNGRARTQEHAGGPSTGARAGWPSWCWASTVHCGLQGAGWSLEAVWTDHAVYAWSRDVCVRSNGSYRMQS